MITDPTLLLRLERAGVRLTVEGDGLRCRAPAGVLTPELQEEIRVRKSELRFFLALPPLSDDILRRLIECAGTRMQLLTVGGGHLIPAEEWIEWRDFTILFLRIIETDLQRKGMRLADFGWSVTPTGDWFRVDGPSDTPEQPPSDTRVAAPSRTTPRP